MRPGSARGGAGEGRVCEGRELSAPLFRGAPAPRDPPAAYTLRGVIAAASPPLQGGNGVPPFAPSGHMQLAFRLVRTNGSPSSPMRFSVHRRSPSPSVDLSTTRHGSPGDRPSIRCLWEPPLGICGPKAQSSCAAGGDGGRRVPHPAEPQAERPTALACMVAGGLGGREPRRSEAIQSRPSRSSPLAAPEWD